MAHTLKDVKIVDPSSPWHLKRVDLIISRGRITDIGRGLESSGKVIEGKGLHVSPGWIDMHMHITDPGFEYKEDINSGLKAARAGGFTSVVTMPGTAPVCDSKAQVQYVMSKAQGLGVKVYPAAALSKGMRGEELSEMVDLSMAGAKLFTDDKKPVAQASLMKRALLYAKDTDVCVASMAQDPSLMHGHMNEGVVSTRLGLTGIPHISETIQLQRDIDLLRYTEGRLHVIGLSTAEGVKLVKAAKREGLAITAEVHMANLIWTDEKLKSYDSNYKLSPPLRTDKDRKSLRKGVADGTIDCISSDHRPEDVEHKKLEFGQAEMGLALIESFYSHYQSYLADDIPLERFISCITNGPCEVLNIKAASIDIDKPAVLTCFSPKEKAIAAPVHTKAYNTPCIHPEMTGRVVGTWR